MLDLKLVEQVDLTLSFDNAERLDVRGLYTISLDRLRDIDDTAASKLFRQGYLQLAYIMAQSLNQFGVLAHLRNRRLKQST